MTFSIVLQSYLSKSTNEKMGIAPEFLNTPISEISDQVDSWSLGALIFEILFGSAPSLLHGM
jgi:serine/threonine protein kinase